MPDKGQIEHDVAQHISRLPPMPENVSTLVHAAENHEDDARLLELVKSDPGLCADLLHLANVFTSVGDRKIETIDEAVEDVGIQPLAQLIAVWYARNVTIESCAHLRHLDEYFAHSREISAACRILAEKARLPLHECETYAVGGLIHDIGRLVILLVSDQLAAPLAGTHWNKMRSMVDDERELLGMNHCEVGMQICLRWNLSPFMQELVLRHHTPFIDSEFSYPGALTFLAHFVSASDFTGDILASMLPAEILDSLHLEPDDFHQARREFFADAEKHK